MLKINHDPRRRLRTRIKEFGAPRLVLLLAFGLTLFTFQTFHPFVSLQRYEDWSEPIYGAFVGAEEWLTGKFGLTKYHHNLLGSEVSKESEPLVAIVEIDDETIEQFKWPIPRKYFVQMFDKLESQGRPVLLSMLSFQRLSAEGTGAVDPVALDTADTDLAARFKSYGKVVGSGLEISAGSELDDEEETLLRLKSIIIGTEFQDGLPYLPLQFREDPAYVGSEAHFGLPSRFGVTPIAYCAPLYLSLKEDANQLALPSSWLWATALVIDRPIQLANGLIAKPTLEKNADLLAPSVFHFSQKHCLSGTSEPTLHFLQRRGIQQLSFADFVLPTSQLRLKPSVKLVILASGDARRYRGPGRTSDDDGIAKDHELIARFITDMVEGRSIGREPIVLGDVTAWIQLILGMTLLAAVLFLRRWVLGALSFGLLTSLFIWSFWHVLAGRYHIPVAAMITTGVDLGVLGVVRLWSLVRDYRFIQRFTSYMRHALSQCNNLQELEVTLKSNIRFEFEQSFALLFGYSEDAYTLPDDPQILLKNLKDRPLKLPSSPEALIDEHNMTVSHTILNYGRSIWSPFASRAILLAETVIHKDGSVLGRAKMSIRVDDWRLKRAQIVLSEIGEELRLHWGRLELLQLQKQTEFQRVIFAKELETGQIMQSFLLPKAMRGRIGDYEYGMSYKPYGPMTGDWLQMYLPAKEAGKPEFGMFALGDVVGKGTSAALSTAAIAGVWGHFQNNWRGQLPEPQILIEELAQAIHRVILGIFNGSQYSTFSFLFIFNQRVWITSLGSPPWLHFKPSGELEVLRLPICNPLGTYHDIKPTIREVQISAGEVLLACSDGVLDGSAARFRLKKSFAIQPQILQGSSVFTQIEDLVGSIGAVDALPDDKSVLMLRRL